MDPLSIATACVGLAGTITTMAFNLTTFVCDVRDARSEIDAVSRELLSLKSVPELIADDFENAPRPPPDGLLTQISGVLSNCKNVVAEVEGCVQTHQGSRIQKGARWVAFGRGDMARLRATLEAHKTTLNLALEMLSLTTLRDVQQEAIAVKQNTDVLVKDSKDIVEGTARILEAIADLQSKLPGSPRFFMLSRYLDELTTYAETVSDDAEARFESLTIQSADDSDAGVVSETCQNENSKERNNVFSSKPNPPNSYDRWNQIRRNAAERAAQPPQEDRKEEKDSAGYSKTFDSDGEETIESRVRRIQARVAELVGQMEPRRT
ncbi:uncharacterized protein LY79DRAFT_217305 [Colletotrichum navitas]|uniref:Azaphilone pigments biosynthesis cluster protein L N-terminal domain-containing protein n=1 Tax=Colletotrichum navitas TaxID=681940 RepID=A0AAD8PZ92_9PEZI|nr:uncharacterized protein LY79DRAFT_217305 [Colletotrichum navitas]KAK1590392.1 hypothetical protein LY79DRAFT_217305 [Colletotrichum navitas]